ncbi:glycosyltransferase [Halodurantibacterium flavum]
MRDIRTARPLAQILHEGRRLASGDLLRALAQEAGGARLEEVLAGNALLSRDALVETLGAQHGAEVLAPDPARADPRRITAFGLSACLREGILPLNDGDAGEVTVLTARPAEFDRHRRRLEALFGPVRMAVASAGAIEAAIASACREPMRARAESRTAPVFSARTWPARSLRAVLGVLALGLATLGVLWPQALFAGLLIWATLSLGLVTALRLGAALAHLGRRPAEPAAARMLRLPTVSILVPLYRETDIAPRLVARLGRLAYPRDLLDVLLVTEERDEATRTALAGNDLPPWIRVITVPDAPLRTKPRALNYALDFCRGTIIGVYDAEDAPEPDQIHRVVRRFHTRGADLACVQGVLDYYNPRTNWLARCFTIEYAVWFRVILPGMERLGLSLPLGGTTLFFRRDVLEDLGGWDAHNVTEDADLGIRLSRMGYRTEVMTTVTGEEANCHLMPWVRQRSRWLKGYAMTWIVHMRAPRRLLADLGWRRFLGVQVIFAATLSQFLLAPLLWGFWLLALGFGYPLAGHLPQPLMQGLVTVFLCAELLAMGIAATALSGPRHHHLLKWVPSLPLYFPLATLAAYKALAELVWNPFYWDKTRHGIFDRPARRLRRTA